MNHTKHRLSKTYVQANGTLSHHEREELEALTSMWPALFITTIIVAAILLTTESKQTNHEQRNTLQQRYAVTTPAK